MRPALVVFVIALVALVVAPPCVSAQTVNPPADLATKIKSGDTLYVLDASSRETTGVLGTISASSLTLMVDGQLREVPFSDVRRITRRGGDPLWNGILIGACLGALLGAGSQGPEFMVGGAVFYGGIGGLIDWGKQGRVVVYRAPKTTAFNVMPYLSEERRGIRISLSF